MFKIQDFETVLARAKQTNETQVVRMELKGHMSSTRGDTCRQIELIFANGSRATVTFNADGIYSKPTFKEEAKNLEVLEVPKLKSAELSEADLAQLKELDNE